MIKMIFIGNPLWGDDGVGPYLLDLFSSRLGSGGNAKWQGLPAVILSGGTGGLNLLNFMDGANQIFFFDAINTQGKPGDVYKIPASALEDWPAQSSHDFGLEQVLRLYYEIEDHPLSPDNIWLYGVEIDRLDFGEGISEVVKKSCDALFESLIQEFEYPC